MFSKGLFHSGGLLLYGYTNFKMATPNLSLSSVESTWLAYKNEI
jgi:hypothetical protein